MPIEDQNQSQDNSYESAFTDAAASNSAAPPPVQVTPQSAASGGSPAPAQQAVGAADTSAAPIPVQPQLSPFAAAARDAGLQYEGMSDNDIAAAMGQQIARMRPYANYGQQMAPYADQIREYFEHGREPQPQQTPVPAEAATDEWSEDKYFTDKWSAPKWEDTFNFAIQNGMVQRSPETGLYEATPGYESMVMEILPSLNRAVSWTAQQWQGITRGNPYKQFYDVLVEPMRHTWQSDIERMVSEQLERQSQMQQINSFEARNASWLYMQDPTTGQTTLAPKGQVFYAEIDRLRDQFHITDPQALIELASRLVGMDGQSPAPTQAAAPTAPQVVDPQVASADKQATFIQNALQRASHSPQAGGYSAVAPDHPMSVSETDLNSMFVSDFRQAQGVGSR